MNILGLCGTMGTGKSTVARILVERHGYVEVALADEIKRTAARWWGFTEETLWGPSERRNDSVEVAHDWRDKKPAPMSGWCVESFRQCGRCGAEEDHLAPCSTKCALTARRALQLLGTEIGRMIDRDVWSRMTINIARELLSDEPTTRPPYGTPTYDRRRGVERRLFCPKGPAKGICVSDVRFESEAHAIVEAGGVVWRIERPKPLFKGGAATLEITVGGVTTSETFTHASERLDIDPSLFARTIVNDRSLEELAAKVEEAMR